MHIAINGFGRIGRIFFRQIYNHPEVEIVAVNDLGDKENLIYLLEHDSVYGKFQVPRPTSPKDEVFGGRASSKFQDIKFLQERDPAKLPWKDLKVDVVVESTGLFTSYEKAKAHLDAGAKRVVITAPPTYDVGDTTDIVSRVLTFTPNICPGDISKFKITSNASCTTNAVTPVLKIMLKNPGVKKALLSTVHGYTATQALVDSPVAKDFRRGRAAAINIVPSTTGAAEAVANAMPETEGIFDGVAMRVPVASGSIIDITFVSKRKTSAEEINKIFKEAAKSKEWEGILKVSEEPLVSTDILGEPYGSIVDLSLTKVIDDDLVKVFSWYDNEWGYCAMLLKHLEMLKDYI